MADEDKLINIILKYSTVGAEGAKQDSDDVNKSTQDLRQSFSFTSDAIQKNTGNARALTAEYRNMRTEARQLGVVSRELAMVGGLMTAGLLLDAKNYVNAVGRTTAASAAWLDAEEKIKQANLGIGQSAEQAALPALQQTATYLQSLAQIVQQNPWIVQGALSVGGVLATVGAIGSVVSQVMKVVASAGMLATKMGLGSSAQAAYGVAGGQIGPAAAGASGGVGVGAAALNVAAVLVGAEIGNVLGNAINKALGQHEQNFADNFMTVVRLLQLPMTLLVKGLGELIPGFAGTANAFITMENNLDHLAGSALGASMDVEENAKKQEDAAAKGGIITDQQVQAFIGYQDQMAKAESTHDQQRADTVDQFGQRMADSERQAEQQRADIVANFADQQAQQAQDRGIAIQLRDRNFAEQQDQAAQQNAEQRAKTVRNGQEAELKAQEAFKVAQARAEQEHQNKLLGFAQSRDALGLVREQAAFQQKKQQDTQDFNTQQRDRRQNLNQQLADMDNAYQEQRARSIQQFQQQNADAAAQEALQDQRAKAQQAKELARLDATHAAEIKKMQDQEYDTLQKLYDSYRAQQDLINKNFTNQLIDLGVALGGDRALRNAYLKAEHDDLVAWIAANRGLLTTQAANPTGGAAPAKPSTNLGASATATSTTQAAGFTNSSGYHYGNARAAGGSAYGLSLVGERGPELVNLPNGSYVHTAQETRALGAMFANQNQMQSAGRGGSLTINLQSGSLTLSQVRTEIARSLDVKLGDLVGQMLGA